MDLVMSARKPVSVLIVSLLLVAVLCSCQSTPVSRSDSSAPSPSPQGAFVFQTECSKCHRSENVLKPAWDERTWFDTVQRMKRLNKADITDEEIRQLVCYHSEQQKRYSSVFETKCRDCHPGKNFSGEALSPEQIRASIKRMQQKAGNTITDEDVDIIIGYHIRQRYPADQGRVICEPGQQTPGAPAADVRSALFEGKCSECHESERSMKTLKDERSWENTIRTMQRYSAGTITDDQADDIIRWHVEQQKQELNVFQQSCTVCHPEEKAAGITESDPQWEATLQVMQKKSPELITDEKIQILIRYHQKRESLLAGLFEGKCSQCHIQADSITPFLSQRAQNALIIQANAFSTGAMPYSDIKTLFEFHSAREKQEMKLFESNCNRCHPPETPGSEPPAKRTRKQWILFISGLQNKIYGRDVENSINTQIDFHILRQMNPSK